VYAWFNGCTCEIIKYVCYMANINMFEVDKISVILHLNIDCSVICFP
jgi:hypothetical protein